MRVRFTSLVACSLAVTACLSGCSTSGLNLTEDRRVRIQSPKDGARVSLPLTISWDSSLSSADDVQFAVFVDRQAIKPGQTLKAIGAHDDYCRSTPSCPDTAYLNRHGVYVVSGDAITLTELRDLRRTGVKNDVHQIVIVVLEHGRRDGEGFFSRTVTVRR